MSMTDTPTDEEPEEFNPASLPGLREAARQGEAARRELADRDRTIMFLKAGIDTESDLGEMLFKTWDGGDDVEALKTKATNIGLLKGDTTPAKTPEQLAAEQAAEDQDLERGQLADTLGSSGVPAGDKVTGPDPRDASLEEFQRDINNGVERPDAMGDAMARVVGAGHVQFDPRMKWDQAKHDAEALEADRRAMRGRRNTPGA